jgi:hypothetical protein
MNAEKKKIIFVDDNYEGGENSSDVNVTNIGGDQMSESTEQFVENTQFNTSASSEDVPDMSPESSDGSVENFTTFDGGENMDSNIIKDDVSVSSDDSDLISEGGRSSVSSGSSVSTVNTTDLLSVDPMYIRLTKFLETNVKLEGGGEVKKNVTEFLGDISESLKELNTTFKEMLPLLKNMAINNVI